MPASTHDELLCIMFTDLVGWTELGDRVGDDEAHAVRREHFEIVRGALNDHRGREVKTAGDSVLATFRSALDAVRCAAAIQDAVAGTLVQVRVGVHAGEPIEDDGDVFGTAVNVASRLCNAAPPGDVLVSELLRSLVGRRGGVVFDDFGALELKGARDAVRAFSVRTATRSVPSRAPSPPVRARATARRLDRTERSLLCSALVEREREMEALNGGLRSLPDAGGVVILAGEAGVGKSRLIRELTALAESRGLTVLSGRSVPSATPVAYRPLTEAFLAAFRSSPPSEAPELAGFGGQLARLVPGWRGDRVGGADESPVLLGEAVVRLLRVASSAGCVLVLEDLHWADAETLSVVEYLADALQQEAALCVCTARPEDAAVETLTRLRRHRGVTVLGVERLTTSGVERAVASCLGVGDPPPDLVATVASNSEGNPFLIEELLAGMVVSGALRAEEGAWTTAGRLTPQVPFDFSDSIRSRLAGLDTDARRVLRAAALLGRRFDWELLPALADVDGRTVVEALRVGVDEQLVEEDDEAFRFRHALTREAVLGELLGPERKDLARRALPAVEGAHPGLPGSWCEMAADLAQEAGFSEVAVGYLLMSARRALANGALTTAESTARQARTLAEGTAAIDDVDELLVQILAMAGKTDQAAVVGEPLEARLHATDEQTERRANVLVVLARAAVAAGDADRAQAMVERARALSGALDDSFAARVEAVAAHVALEQDRLDDASALARGAIQRAAATQQPAVECEALEVLGRAERYAGDRDDRAWFERSAALAAQHGLATWEIRARHEIALMSAYTDGEVGPLHEVREFASRRGALVSVAVMDLALAEIGLGRFDRAGCLDSAQRCVEASRRYGLATLPVASLWLAGGYALADDVPAMEAACAQALEPDPDDPRILGDLWGRVRAVSSMVRDDRDQLVRDLDAMMPYARVAPISTSIFPNRIFWALVHAIDDDDHGTAALAELEATARVVPWTVFTVAVDAIRAVALGRAGRLDEAATSYTAAFARRPDTADEGSARYFHMLAAEAAIRDGWGDPVSSLRGSEAFCAARGYDRIVRRCHRLLAVAGAPVPRRGRGDSVVPEQLRALGITSRELDVLALVAEGLSNREVAERLFLSPKTVERHLSSLFDRTGQRSRAALAERFRELSG